MNEKRTSIEIIAPSIEEAIEEGLADLGVAEEEVDIEVLDEGTKGLFGIGSRQCRVRLTRKGDHEMEFESATLFEDLPYPEVEPVKSQSEDESAVELVLRIVP